MKKSVVLTLTLAAAQFACAASVTSKEWQTETDLAESAIADLMTCGAAYGGTFKDEAQELDAAVLAWNDALGVQFADESLHYDKIQVLANVREGAPPPNSVCDEARRWDARLRKFFKTHRTYRR